VYFMIGFKSDRLQLSGWSRNLVIAGAGAAAGLTEVSLNCLYMWYFGTGDSRSDKTGKSDRTLLEFVVICRILNAFTTCFIVGFAPPSIALTFVWAVTSRLGLCGFSFWRISAQCWLVDEDCQFGPEPGRRREGIIFGALSMIQNFSGAFLSSAVFIGLGIAGLKTRNCTAVCEGIEINPSGDDCVETCFANVILSQPDSLRLFVRVVIGFWAPFCELMVAYHSWRFPIKGSRLRKLYNSIRQSRGEDLTNDDKIAVVAGGGRGRIDQIAAHQATSKTGVHLGRARGNITEDWMSNLSHTIAFADSRPGPKSMAVFFEWSDSRSLSPKAIEAIEAKSEQPVSPLDIAFECEGEQSPSTVPPEAAHIEIMPRHIVRI